MADQREKNLAKILVNYSTKVGPKDLVAIAGQPPATPLIQEIFREVLRAGGYPYLFARSFPRNLPGFEDLDYIFLKEANQDQLQHSDQILLKVAKEFDVVISIFSEFNTHNRSSVDPTRIVLTDKANANKGVGLYVSM